MATRLWLLCLLSAIQYCNELSAQPAVDDSPSCENSTLDQTVKLITKGFTEVKKQFIQDLAEVKDLLGSCQQNWSAVSSSNLSSCVPVLVQQNLDGSNFFNKSWAEFKAGFNDTTGNYWLGNELLHQLTTSGPYKLRFDLQARDNSSWYYAEYGRFIVHNEASKYKMHVSGYSGNAGDALSYSDGMMFTTLDEDNDLLSSDNCAVSRGGGFWYKDCIKCGVNVVRGRPDDFKWHGRVETDRVTFELQSTRMWLTC